jgi:hypothetical protein
VLNVHDAPTSAPIAKPVIDSLKLSNALD